MRYNTLGRSGLKVSAIAMGTFTFGGEGNFAMVGNQGVDEARSLFDCALDHGVNLIDTANMYSTGTAEEIVGVVQKNQDLAQAAVHSMSASRDQAEQGLEFANQAGAVIVEIQDGAQRVVSAVGQFASQLKN